VSKKRTHILATPEINLFLFAFLLNFVYEVWQAPYYEFYSSPSLADKVKDLTHCSFGDGVIILVCSWVVSALVRSRDWVLHPTPKLTLLFTSIGLAITLVIETYRVNVSQVYGVAVLAVPFLGMSGLAVIQWIMLPPIILYLARRHILGYPAKL
jgi:Na+/melibiose symporter-like transporter